MLLLVPSSLPYPVFFLSPRVDLLLLSIITLTMVNGKVQKNYRPRPPLQSLVVNPP